MNRTKGHWPKGKRRNPMTTDVDRALVIIRNTHSIKQLGRWAQVDPRSLKRYSSGEDIPSPEVCLRIIAAAIHVFVEFSDFMDGVKKFKADPMEDE